MNIHTKVTAVCDKSHKHNLNIRVYFLFVFIFKGTQ